MKRHALAVVAAVSIALAGCFPVVTTNGGPDVGAVVGSVLSGVSQLGTPVIAGPAVVQPATVVAGDPAVPPAPASWVSKVVGWTNFGCRVLPVGTWIDSVFFHNQLAQPEQVANDICDYVKNAPAPRARARLARSGARQIGPAVIAGVSVRNVVVKSAR